MNAIVFEHVPLAELPQAWRDKLGQVSGETVTVRIEAEGEVRSQAGPALHDDALFGMWRDRADMADVAGYVRELRASRFDSGESRNEP